MLAWSFSSPLLLPTTLMLAKVHLTNITFSSSSSSSQFWSLIDLVAHLLVDIINTLVASQTQMAIQSVLPLEAILIA